MKRFVILLAILVAACSDPPPGGVTTLIYASPYSRNHPFSRADRRWIDFVEKRSGGKLRIRPIWSGALLSSDQSMTELRHGVADIGLVTPIYARGGAHLLRVQSGFYAGVKAPLDQVRLYYCLADNNLEYQRELRGLKILAVQGGSLPGVMTRDRPIKRLGDLKGLRIRVPAELVSILLDLGADPVSMPMSDVYSALAKGVLDGVVAPADTLKALHFAEVTHYFTELEVPRGAYPARAMSMKRWRSLSAQDRQILEEGKAVWQQAIAQEVTKAVQAGLAFGKRQGISVSIANNQTKRKFLDIYNREADKNAASLKRYGIDGTAVLARARHSVGADGQINCGNGAS